MDSCVVSYKAEEALLQDRLLSYKKKRDKSGETAVSFQACKKRVCGLGGTNKILLHLSV